MPPQAAALPAVRPQPSPNMKTPIVNVFEFKRLPYFIQAMTVLDWASLGTTLVAMAMGESRIVAAGLFFNTLIRLGIAEWKITYLGKLLAFAVVLVAESVPAFLAALERDTEEKPKEL